VSDAGWKVARLGEIPSRSEMPGFSAEEYRTAMAKRAPHILERWADAAARFKGDNRGTRVFTGARERPRGGKPRPGG
jgi:hypothetical protein